MQAETQDWGEEVGKVLVNHIGARERRMLGISIRVSDTMAWR